MHDFKFALNTSTLFPFELDVIEQIRVAAEAGYDGIELWVKDIESYLKEGGSLKTIKEFLSDRNISVVNAITFFKWSDADESTRVKGLVEAEQEMLLLKEIGCKAVAAPPSGNMDDLELEIIAEHFTALTTIAKRMDMEVYLEFWGKANKLATLSEAMYVAMESGLSDVKFLLDPFHMYTGGSYFTSLSYLNQRNIGIFHVNDYPENPTKEQITDSERLFPGDGVAPTEEIANYLEEMNYQGYLSLELFIENYSNRSALEVATHGLKKMKQTYLPNK
ncbi:sugar phosphate isomerase/epimerase family protein [Gracilibacillus sp. D59]|uniref:sugar phosphate isomerase/epimerase family protein n=1 Tax=Gracilibacillus sp. D59 TaxID=3457434 RepID=UPI003FCEBC26